MSKLIFFPIDFDRDKDSFLCVNLQHSTCLFFLFLSPASCFDYNKSLLMVYCNSTVTIDLAGSFIFRIPLLIFTSLKGTNFTLSGFSKEL